jgi:twinkle protein
MEAGELNVVSIPSGTNDMTWIENCYSWIKSIKKWIIYVDNDEAGQKLCNALCIKFSDAKIVSHELKDANEELNVFGVDYIKNVISKAEYPTVIGIDNLANVKMVDPSKMERCLSGISVIDKYCGGFVFPALNIWTGERGSGKSTVLSQSLLNCIEANFKIFVYSGELMSGYFKSWLCSQALGAANIKSEVDVLTGVTNYKVNADMMPVFDNWINEKIYIYNDLQTNEEDKVMNLMQEAYNRYNCRVFVIDNLMTIRFNHGKDKYMEQSSFVDRLRLFVKTNNVIVNLVVHPNKSNEQIGGAGDIRNAAFNEFWIKKLGDEDEPSGYDTLVTITKNRYYGKTDISGAYHFSEKSKRIYEKSENERTYSWNTFRVTEIYEPIPF